MLTSYILILYKIYILYKKSIAIIYLEFFRILK
jgi:hypothetical protein